MPLFEFKCEECGVITEALCSYSVEEIECEFCCCLARKIISQTGNWVMGRGHKGPLPTRNENGSYSFNGAQPPPPVDI